MRLAQQYKNQLSLVFLFLLLISLYAVLITLEIPYTLTQFFSRYSTLFFVLILFLYLSAFRLPNRKSWIAGTLITVVLISLALSFKWNAGYSDSKIIGGLLPYKDAYGYYNGARLLLNGELITGRGSGRPLFPGFLSVLLFITGLNLKWSLAILSGLAGCCLLIAAMQVKRSHGPISAALFMTLLYLYLQHQLGYAHTELLGLIFGSLGFTLMWASLENKNFAITLFGIVLVLLGISARPGAFFILPLFVLWIGWVSRKKEDNFSFRYAGIAVVLISGMYLLSNNLIPRLIVEPNSTTFGNFAPIIYGQVMGGTGWTYATQSLGPGTPSNVILQEAFKEFIEHPHSLLIASAKSYRDFFSPNHMGVFSFISSRGISIIDSLFWAGGLLLLIWGLINSSRELHQPASALIISAFIGIFLSIPFLPPIDGGRRFHASTTPFFFIIPSVGLGYFLQFKKRDQKPTDLKLVTYFSMLLVIVALIGPILIYSIREELAFTPPTCENNQVPFAVQLYPEAHIDITPIGSNHCSLAPEICLSDFKANGTEKSVDDFFQEIVYLAESSNTITRILPGNNLIDGNFHFFVGSIDQFPENANAQVVSGCASQLRTQFQSIYLIQSIIESDLVSSK